jgi:hypothetical protein
MTFIIESILVIVSVLGIVLAVWWMIDGFLINKYDD